VPEFGVGSGIFADSFLRPLLCRARGRCRRAGPRGSLRDISPRDTQVEACEPRGQESDRPEETVKQERAFLRSDPADDIVFSLLRTAAYSPEDLTSSCSSEFVSSATLGGVMNNLLKKPRFKTTKTPRLRNRFP
jgi:hypothetical protein